MLLVCTSATDIGVSREWGLGTSRRDQQHDTEVLPSHETLQTLPLMSYFPLKTLQTKAAVAVGHYRTVICHVQRKQMIDSLFSMRWIELNVLVRALCFGTKGRPHVGDQFVTTFVSFVQHLFSLLPPEGSDSFKEPLKFIHVLA